MPPLVEATEPRPALPFGLRSEQVDAPIAVSVNRDLGHAPVRPLAVYVGHRRTLKRERDLRAWRIGLGHGVGPRPIDAAPGPTPAVPDGWIIVVVDARRQYHHGPDWLARGQRRVVQILASLIQSRYVEIREFGFRCGARLPDFAQRLRLQGFGGRRFAANKIANPPLLEKRQRLLH